MIKGIIYDLDGTLIDTERLHEAAWRSAAESVGTQISSEIRAKQKGMTNEEAAQLISSSQDKEELEAIVERKIEHVTENSGSIGEMEGVGSVVKKLHEKGYEVWICTAAPKAFVLDVAPVVDVVKKLKDNPVYHS